jgi:hypothetical protein
MGEVERFFSSPHLIDVVLGLTVLEAVVLVLLGRGRARGGVGMLRPAGVALMLLPGVCLMLGIRAALDDAAWPWAPAALAAALVAHLADIQGRWRG